MENPDTKQSQSLVSVTVCTVTVVARSITSHDNDHARIFSQLGRCMGIVWVTTSMLEITCMYTKVVTLINIIIIGESFLTLTFEQGRHCLQDRVQRNTLHCKKIIVNLTHVGYVSCMTPF